MKLACICFTKEGETLARGWLDKLAGWECTLAVGYGPQKTPLDAWTQDAFAHADALLFVGAAGIAVRAVAPYVAAKTQDPAVLVADEAGQYVVPLLSGHIGGANQLARKISGLTGATAVITTATDLRGVFSVDDWAARRGLRVSNPERIKEVSGRLLAGKQVGIFSEHLLLGPFPDGVYPTDDRAKADVVVSVFRPGDNECALWLVPPAVTAGIGCRKGTEARDIEALYMQALDKAGVSPLAVGQVASIDLKKDEPGLVSFCRMRGLPFTVYEACRLEQVRGSVSPSEFVQQIAGVDNVCERSALAAGGRLVLSKMAGGGVTIALAAAEKTYDFVMAGT